MIFREERRRGHAVGSAGGVTGDADGNAASESENTAEVPGREDTVPDTAEPENPVPGRLIWLHCPTCDTLEYTEMAMRSGRVHNVCGSHVVEAEVELDLRAEHTIARINLERLNILENLLVEQRRKYEEFVQRLSLAARKPLEAYSFSEALLEKLPIAEVDAFGLLISRFFHQVEGYFPNGAISPAGEKLSSEDGAPTPTAD